MPARRALPLVIALALATPSASEAAVVRGKVASVTDGDTVKVKTGKRVRTLNLAGVDAPTGTECFAAESKTQLAKLLPRGARVKASVSGRSATVTRGATNVNREMVRGGFARAAGSRFAAEQTAADAADAGLWKACVAGPAPPAPGPSPSPTPPQPQPGDVTGQAAIDQMTQVLSNGRWRSFTSSAQSSTEYILNLCGDNTWLRTGQSNVGGVVFKAGQPWRVAEALIKADGSYRGARVEGTVTNADPPTDDTTYHAVLEQLNGQWYWDADEAQHFPGAANCTG